MSFAKAQIDESAGMIVGRLMTVEEFLALPDDGVDRELIRGELREYPEEPPKRFATLRDWPIARLLSRLDQRLNNWVDLQTDSRGVFVSGEVGFQLLGNRDSLVGIDIAYVSNELIAATPPSQSTFDGPPLLAIEILSPSDTFGRIAEKVEVYLQSGVTTWIVDPEFQTVTIHRPKNEAIMFNRDDELIGDPELPNFRLKLAELFPARK